MKKLSEAQKAGLIIAIIIFILTNLPSIYGLLVRPENAVPFEISLCKVSNEVTIDVANEEKGRYLNVPDYDAKIFISSSKKNYIVDDTAELNIKIQDNGILKLSKPYFYLLVFDPSNKLNKMFPCFINENEKQFTGGKDTSYYYPHKWDKWVSPIVYIGGQGRYCNDEYFYIFYNLPNQCISRRDLINGTILNNPNNPIQYTFKITEPGTWRIYVFLFDEEYISRPNVGLLKYSNMPESFQNAIAYGYYELLVRSEEAPIESSGIDASELISVLIKALIAVIGYYGISRKEIYPKLKSIYYNYSKKLKSEILGLLGLLVLITIYIVIMFKFLS